MKAIKFIIAAAAIACVAIPSEAKKMKDLKIYINPGHGGYTSDDRNIPIYPFAQGDSMGYWESKSNLYKGLHMYHILDSLGAKPMLSRIKNTQADDRNLSSISSEANNFGADLFFSIHSNAGENVNYLLMLYRENEIGVPRYPENVTLSNIVADNLQTNEMSNWTRKPQIDGDLHFYRNMWQGGLGVLRYLYVPGLLSEGGMHEHRPQAYRLMNDDYWWLEAWHFVHSIMDFYDVEDRFVTGNVAGVVYDDHNLREMDIPGASFTMIGRDKLAPLCGCYIELLDKAGNLVQKRTTDNIFNGVFVFRNVTPGDYTLRFSKDGYYTVERNVTVKADQVTYANTEMNMKREFPLEITKFGPDPSLEEDGLISCAATLDFEFNCDIDEESFKKAISITPALPGYWKFTDNNHKARYTPNVSLEPGTEYTVRVDVTAKTPDKYYSHPGLAEPFERKFTTRTRARMTPTGHYPADGGEVHFASPTIEIRFDNKIKSTGITNLITVTDSKGTAVPINARACSYNTLSNGFGNAVFAIQSDLKVGETYNVKLSGDVRDAEQLPMGADLRFSFVAKDATADANTEASVVEEFEDYTVLSGDLDASAGMNVKPSVAKTTNPKLYGDAAVKLNYTFADSHDGVAVWHYVPKADALIQFEKNDKLGLYVNGDYTNHELWVSVTSGTDTKWEKLCDLNFRGWQWCEVTLSQLEAGYVYDLDSFKVIQVEDPTTLKGSIVFDNLMKQKGDVDPDGVEGIAADSQAAFRVFPVPANDVINVETTATIKSLQLIDASGVTRAKSSQSSSLDVKDVAPGVYLLRALTSDGLITRRVAVAH